MLTPDLAAELRLAFDDDREADTFLLRLERYGPELAAALRAEYGEAALPESLLEVLLHAYHARPADLRRLDEARLLRPDWLQLPQRLGYVVSPERPLVSLRGGLGYLSELGVNLLHLPELWQGVGESLTLRPEVGKLDDLSALAREMRPLGLSLSLDLPLGERDWQDPETFRAALDFLCSLANRGVEVFCVPDSPSLSPHLRFALRAAMRLAAPAVAFGGAAVRTPSDLPRAFGSGEYHAQLAELGGHTALTLHLWEALATRDTRRLAAALTAFPSRPFQTAWSLSLSLPGGLSWGEQSRGRLEDFYSGVLAGSFARGVRVGSHVEGTSASLAGLEKALDEWDSVGVDEALARLSLLYAVLLGFGGVPLLSLGDEWGHVGVVGGTDWPPETADSALASRLRHLIRRRQQTPQLHAGTESRPLPTPDPRVLVLRREHPLGVLAQVYNFSEQRVNWSPAGARETLGEWATDRLSGAGYSLLGSLELEPYAALWLENGAGG